MEEGINVKHSTKYYPQGNGVVKSSNKNIIRILCKTIIKNKRNFHSSLTNALREDKVTLKVALGNSPYFLVYGKEVILLPSVYLPSLQLYQSTRGTPSSDL